MENENSHRCRLVGLVFGLLASLEVRGGAALCTGNSSAVAIDLATGVRRAASAELIQYSTAWETNATEGATVVIAVDGETLAVANGSGVLDWHPPRAGTYTLTHRVLLGGRQVGETLRAVFFYSALAFAETQTTEVPVPYSWLRTYYPSMADDFDAYEDAAKAGAENGVNAVWECYVAGLDPTDGMARFRTLISMEGETPLISWEPRLGIAEEARRIYTIYGRESLDMGEWATPTNAASRFFRVHVDMR